MCRVNKNNNTNRIPPVERVAELNTVVTREVHHAARTQVKIIIIKTRKEKNRPTPSFIAVPRPPSFVHLHVISYKRFQFLLDRLKRAAHHLPFKHCDIK